jgi:hypothetical protein
MVFVLWYMIRTLVYFFWHLRRGAFPSRSDVSARLPRQRGSCIWKSYWRTLRVCRFQQLVVPVTRHGWYIPPVKVIRRYKRLVDHRRSRDTNTTAWISAYNVRYDTAISGGARGVRGGNCPRAPEGGGHQKRVVKNVC